MKVIGPIRVNAAPVSVAAGGTDIGAVRAIGAAAICFIARGADANLFAAHAAAWYSASADGVSHGLGASGVSIVGTTTADAPNSVPGVIFGVYGPNGSPITAPYIWLNMKAAAGNATGVTVDAYVIFYDSGVIYVPQIAAGW